ncbi:flagellar hook-associated protein FlgK [Nocardioides nematodiphilus]|uniref:flagellar hook-associated protein FlgK n=1 Tax=Nocardioides nematodiphilus TaxID=2849669 RepID=UPI001CD9F463|nr:flagellar hook-associated protein FlgK [Nocardioides nematodiphilus]MCA1983194.1 flagellar hook-associated protein FlgK [Nocardioides nematodiphilus]
MASTFGSLNIAKSGLQYQQIAIDTANNNISNVNTDGYVRRRAEAAEVGGPGQPVHWSYSDGHGQGVATESVKRLSDLLMDRRVRTEHGNLSFLKVQQASMERVEATINEPSDKGVASMLTAYGKAWQDVVNAPDGEAARASVIAAGQSLAASINTQARGLATEVEQQQAAVTENVKQINDDAQKLAQLNHNIFLAKANGSDVGDLEDQRDQIALELANKAGAVVEAQPDGRYTAYLNGNALVPPAGTGIGPDVANTLVANNLATSGDPDQDPTTTGTLSYSIFAPGEDPLTDPPGVADSFALTSGELGGESVLLNYTIKDYRAKLNDLATGLSSVVNAQHGAGFDKNGNAGVDFFSFDPAKPGGAAAQLTVAIAGHPELVAASAGVDASGNPLPLPSNDATNADLISEVLLGKPTAAVPTDGSLGSTGWAGWTDTATNVHSGTNISDMYQSMVAGLGSTVAGLNTQTTNQTMLTSQVDDEREQTVGVSIDEETINLMAAQRAYQASSRVLTVMNEVLDTLINRMGV